MMLDEALIVAGAVFLVVEVLSYLAGREQFQVWKECADRISCMWQGRQMTDGDSWDR